MKHKKRFFSTKLGITLLIISLLISSHEFSTYAAEIKLMSSSSCSTAQTILSQIRIGFNIGNTLDSCAWEGRNNGSHSSNYYETLWGNPVITKSFIDTIQANGFNAIRLPVTWYYNTYVSEDGILIIRSQWLQRVAEVVDYALSNDMYVILDSHHDAPIIWAEMDDISTVSANVIELWSQIAYFFKDYDEHLIFESFNEINTKKDSWVYTDSSAEATNILNQCFVNAVRNCGGYNPDRILICSTYLNETSQEILEHFTLPADTVSNKLAVSVHCYESSYNQDIEALFSRLQLFSERINAPVVITEFGTTEQFIPTEYRASHAANYIARANKHNIKCFWWDDGSKYRLFNRKDNSAYAPAVIQALNNPVEFETAKSAYYLFNDISCFTYHTIDTITGKLTDAPQGALTLNIGNTGMPISQGLGYRITLASQGKGNGISMNGIALYDAHQNLVSYIPLYRAMSYDFTAPKGAAYMRITFYNPWGYRSLAEYNSYLSNEQLYLEVTEYVK